MKNLKKNLLAARIVVMVIGILVGVLLVVIGNILTESTVKKMVDVALIIYGIIIVIGNIPGLISGIANVHKAAGVFDLVASVLGIALGFAMIFYQGALLVVLVAIYLIIFPLIRVLLAQSKGEQFKRELLRIVLGVVLLVFVPALLDAAFTVIFYLLVVGGWVVIGLSALFGLIEIIRIASAKNIVLPSENGHAAQDTIYVDAREKKD